MLNLSVQLFLYGLCLFIGMFSGLFDGLRDGCGNSLRDSDLLSMGCGLAVTTRSIYCSILLPPHNDASCETCCYEAESPPHMRLPSGLRTGDKGDDDGKNERKPYRREIEDLILEVCLSPMAVQPSARQGEERRQTDKHHNPPYPAFCMIHHESSVAQALTHAELFRPAACNGNPPQRIVFSEGEDSAKRLSRSNRWRMPG